MTASSPADFGVYSGKAAARQPEEIEVYTPEGKLTSHAELDIPMNSNIAHPPLKLSVNNLAPLELDSEISRSTSATSTLDPYYFSVFSGGESPAPPLPEADEKKLAMEGSSPRWPVDETHSSNSDDNAEKSSDRSNGFAIEIKDVTDIDDRGSPWTIEAIDGEMDDVDQPMVGISPARDLRSRPSIMDESGGEEILYPRKTTRSMRRNFSSDNQSSDGASGKPDTAQSSPSSFHPSPTRKARKRTSDEFAIDQTGKLIGKPGSAGDISDQESNKHRPSSSITQGSSESPFLREKGKEKKRINSMRLSNIDSPKFSTTNRATRHLRQQSAGSPSARNESELQSRRLTGLNEVVNRSMSPLSRAQSLRKSSSGVLAAAQGSALQVKDHNPISSSVAHSLLRGSQEGWSALNDEAAVETLRKLDGLTTKSSRTRMSFASTSRSNSHSRPSSPTSGAARNADLPNKGLRRFNSFNNGSYLVADEPKVKHRPLEAVSDDVNALLSEGPSQGNGECSLKTEVVRRSSTSYDASRKVAAASVRSSTISGKRGSASSTNYTSTPTSSSRDSTSLSTTTSATSASVLSNRLSFSKVRRNSVGSDVSSVHSAEIAVQRERTSTLLTGEQANGAGVPPVPPLPKDLSTFKPPSHTPAAPVVTVDEQKETEKVEPLKRRSVSLDIPVIDSFLEVSTGGERFNETSPIPTKAPSKKWSFTGALHLRRSTSPLSSRQRNDITKSSSSFASTQSPRNPHLRASTSKEFPPQFPMLKATSEEWTPGQPGAMVSAPSLTSSPSLQSLAEFSPSASPVIPPQTPAGNSDRDMTRKSRSTSKETKSRTSHTAPVTPSSKSHKETSSKRLTPSSIPFFRRSSSQSIQVPPTSAVTVSSNSPTLSSATSDQEAMLTVPTSPRQDVPVQSPTTPGFSQRKSSMLSLGFPSLLKGSHSKKNLHPDKANENYSGDKDKDNNVSSSEKTKGKKDDKDRSESRISVLMGRRRGKTLSSTDPKKMRPVTLPPIQIAAFPQGKTDRLLNARSTIDSSSSSTTSLHASVTRRDLKSVSESSSVMQRMSEMSLRNTRNQLPTIAGSPSVVSHSSTGLRSQRDNSDVMSISSGLPATSSAASLVKDTPTRIPRIASRSSTVTSPALKIGSSLSSSRRTSLVMGPHAVPSLSYSHSNGEDVFSEFGMLTDNDTQRLSSSPAKAASRASPGNMSFSARPNPTRTSSGLPVLGSKSNQESLSFKGLRKTSVGSVSSMTSSTALGEAHRRSSGSSPTRLGKKLLSPKMSLPTTRLSGSSTTPNLHHGLSGSPRRQSITTPSPVPSSVGEDELLGDEEMLQYIKRQQARKLANGAKKEDLDELLNFPEPLPPGRSCSPSDLLKSDRATHLADYELREILDYSSVFYIGNKNSKKMANRDNSTNNYSYDDERGDYIVIPHDHLAYRYEIIDTLGKGSFGQVLHCRDHCTGESVAVKIIRNKKRFHHQALVEIKILENLRKWDPEEKHHVIKMTEHFYFRNHLCIAMELLSINLYELIKANGFAGFSTTLIRRFTNQMLSALSLMRHHRIVHCDLKPENVLLRHPAKSAIKVIDFGSSCFEHEKVYTYIQSRFYRSPEVILGMNYNMAIDMWSLGCILAELYTGYPIFPGENEQEQLSCIMEVLGIPDKDLINRSSRKRLFFDSTGAPRPVVNSKGRRRRAGTKTLAQVLRCDDELFIDFVSKCLHWDPERRIKPQSAMRHPFVTAGRRATKLPPVTPSSTRTNLSTSLGLSLTARGKILGETPKKAQISAPTPLTARSLRTAPAAGGSGVQMSVGGTLASQGSSLALSASKSHRASQGAFGSRATGSLVTAAAK